VKGERLAAVVESPTNEEGWPDYWVVTNRGFYEYVGQGFLKRDGSPAGCSIAVPPEFQGMEIVEVLGDGESAVIVQENGNKVIFDLVHDPFGEEIVSSRVVRFLSEEESLSWADELSQMEPLF